MQRDESPLAVGPRGRVAAGADLADSWAEVFSEYKVVLERAPLSPRTRRAYASHVAGYLGWLQAGPDLAAAVDPLRDPHGRDFAVRDYKSWLKSVRQVKPATINAYLAAIDHFYDEYLRVARLGATKRERLPDRAPEALDDVEQRKFLRAARRTNSARNIAIVYLLIYTGIRVEEASSLDVEDLAMSARRGKLTVWQGKGTDGGKYREVPLHTAARSRLRAWLDERSELPAAATTGALFLSRLGARLSDRSIRTIVTELGAAAGLVHTEGSDAGQSKVHPQTLRHTFATQLIRSGVDVVLVADLLGHASLDTTRVYTHASMADLERALEDNLITDD